MWSHKKSEPPFGFDNFDQNDIRGTQNCDLHTFAFELLTILKTRKPRMTRVSTERGNLSFQVTSNSDT